MKPKLLTTLKNYSKDQLLKDIIAGIIVAIVALPLSIALAIASGVSPEKGIHTAIIAGFFISMLGGSRVQIGGPTAAFVVIIYGIIQRFGLDGLIIATILAGIILIVMGLLRFGVLIKFIPTTITVGFTAGIAVTLFVNQLKDFLGMEIESIPSEFFEKVICYGKHFNTINRWSVLIGIISVAIMIVWPKVNKVIPGSLIAVIIATILVKLFHMDVATIGSVFGELSNKFPAPHLPKISFGIIQQLLPSAFTIAILAGIESLLSCVVSDGMVGDRHDSNMELVAQGVGNVASGLFGGIPATGAIARTATNVKSGGRTPVAGMVHAITLAMIMMVCMPLAQMIPMPALAAVLMVVAYNMSEWREFVNLLHSPKSDIAILLVTFFLTVFFDLVIAIEVGVVAASLLFLNRQAQETIVKNMHLTDDEEEYIPTDIQTRDIPEHTEVFEIVGPMFFGAADQYMSICRSMNRNIKVVIIRMHSVPSMDVTACKTLQDIYEYCRKKNITMILSHTRKQPMSVLEKAGLDKLIGQENICPHLDDALERARQILD